MATQQVAAQQSNMELGAPPMELGTRPCAKRVVALPLEGALSDGINAFLRGEAPAALPMEGALSDGINAFLRGEAPAALPMEGALSPSNSSNQNTGFCIRRTP